jgi:folate-binding protein YgfZ
MPSPYTPRLFAGYQAFHSGAATLDLSDHGRIVVTGEDRARLIHGLATNHIQQLRPGENCYTFFLNAQGRILADAYILCREDSLWVDTEAETRGPILQHIEHYVIADDVTLEDATEQTFCVAVEGPDAPGVLAKIEAIQPKASIVTRVSFTGAQGFRVIGHRDVYNNLMVQLTEAGAVTASYEEANVVRVEHFRPRYGDDFGTSTLAQETGRDDALHFKKGCYLGQEIVERVRSRGLANRILTGLEIEGTTVFEKNQELRFEDARAGKITSCVFSPVMGEIAAIGMVRLELAKVGTVLSAGISRAIVAGK